MAKTIMNEVEMNRALTRISYEIIERNQGVDNVILAGIETRGAIIAQRIANRLKEIEGTIDVVDLDIKPYRDDLVANGKPVVRDQVFADKKVVIVDDVLFTGRTIRAAMDAIVDRGRPQSIALAILVDRGHRELPIRPDYIGKNIPTSREERVKVSVKEIDTIDNVTIEE